jgi:hypothetical protein
MGHLHSRTCATCHGLWHLADRPAARPASKSERCSVPHFCRLGLHLLSSGGPRSQGHKRRQVPHELEPTRSGDREHLTGPHVSGSFAGTAISRRPPDQQRSRSGARHWLDCRGAHPRATLTSPIGACPGPVAAMAPSSSASPRLPPGAVDRDLNEFPVASRGLDGVSVPDVTGNVSCVSSVYPASYPRPPRRYTSTTRCCMPLPLHLGRSAGHPSAPRQHRWVSTNIFLLAETAPVLPVRGRRDLSHTRHSAVPNRGAAGRR